MPDLEVSVGEPANNGPDPFGCSIEGSVVRLGRFMGVLACPAGQKAIVQVHLTELGAAGMADSDLKIGPQSFEAGVLKRC